MYTTQNHIKLLRVSVVYVVSLQVCIAQTSDVREYEFACSPVLAASCSGAAGGGHFTQPTWHDPCPYSWGLKQWFISGTKEKQDDLLIFPIPKGRESCKSCCADATHSHYVQRSEEPACKVHGCKVLFGCKVYFWLVSIKMICIAYKVSQIIWSILFWKIVDLTGGCASVPLKSYSLVTIWTLYKIRP